MDLKKQPNHMVPVRDVQGDKETRRGQGRREKAKKKGSSQ